MIDPLDPTVHVDANDEVVGVALVVRVGTGTADVPPQPSHDFVSGVALVVSGRWSLVWSRVVIERTSGPANRAVRRPPCCIWGI